MNISFPDLIERVLDSYGISEAQLARMVGTTQPTINRLRRGVHKQPGYMTGAKLMELLEKAPA
jgi:predicted transcriptional regulator